MVESVVLDCKTCGHWKKGPIPKAEVIDWLRVHRCARIFSAPHLTVRCESSCPNPCGSETSGEGTGE